MWPNDKILKILCANRASKNIFRGSEVKQGRACMVERQVWGAGADPRTPKAFSKYAKNLMKKLEFFIILIENLHFSKFLNFFQSFREGLGKKFV